MRAEGFSAAAARFMAVRLFEDGPTPGEALVDAARAAGYAPRDDRAFGAVFKMLLRWGVKVVGTCPRRKGHNSAGGKVYGIQPGVRNA